MEELPIGRRVAYWRSRRKISQQVFADRLGKSKSWVDKVERGIRKLDKFSTMSEIAEVLQLDVQLLLGREAERRVDGGGYVDQVEVQQIRAALECYEQISPLFRANPEPPTLVELEKAVRHGWFTFQRARYGELARCLPKLLRDCQAADFVSDHDDGKRRAAHLLGQVYQIASSTLRKLGEPELAWLAGDRAMLVSQRANDELLAGCATFRVACALSASGRPLAALEVNVNSANRLAKPSGGTPQQLSVYGLLLLQGAMAAAKIGDTTTVRDLFNSAEQAAAALGSDQNHYWTCFGPTNVKLHRAAAAVELGEGRLATEIHQTIDPIGFATLMPERRAQHYLDMARAFVQGGEIGNAAEMLLKGERVAPAEFRCRPLAHKVLGEILRRTRGTAPIAVTDLAQQMGVTV